MFLVCVESCKGLSFIMDEIMEESGKENCFFDWVSCFVCFKSIKGNDVVINDYLGWEFWVYGYCEIRIYFLGFRV